MKRQRYSAEFKSEAVKLILIEGIPAKEVSERLGVTQGLLHKWKRAQLEKLEVDASPGAQSPKEMAEELVQLRKRLAKAERMNEILKKTVGYLSEHESCSTHS